MNEPFFQGHFPGNPIMPGVLICEALAQVGAVVILSKPEFKNKLAVFTGINNFKFKHQVVPGETLRLEVELTKFRSVMGKADVCAYVGDEVAAKGEISFALIDIRLIRYRPKSFRSVFYLNNNLYIYKCHVFLLYI